MKKVIFYGGYWACGDGCCSDSWSDVNLYEDGKLINQKSHILSMQPEYYEESELRERAEDLFDLEGEEFELES